MVGHSRAGRDIFEVATKIPELGVDGFISIAPSMVSPLNDPPVDAPAGIIIPQLDSDVSSLDGASLFDILESDENRKSSSELIYLKEGNHGGFSTALVRPDPFATQESIAQTMLPEKQREFLYRYTELFLNSVLEKQATPVSLEQNTDGFYAGCEVLIQTDSFGKTIYKACDEPKNNIYAERSEAHVVNACSILDNTAGAFLLPGAFQKYNLLRVCWSSENAKISIPINEDLSSFSCLQFDITQDSSAEQNRQQNQDVTVILEDSKGKRSFVEFPKNSPALQ